MVLTLQGFARALLLQRCHRVALARRHAWRRAEAIRRRVLQLLLTEWLHVVQVFFLFFEWVQRGEGRNHTTSTFWESGQN